MLFISQPIAGLKSMKKTILIIIIVVLVGGGGYLLLSGGYQSPSQEVVMPEEESFLRTFNEVREITVLGGDYDFRPSSISIKAGEKVKLTFKNDGKVVHNLVFSELGISTKTIASGISDVIEFTAPIQGSYTFFCSIPGHRAAGMEGSLKVE